MALRRAAVTGATGFLGRHLVRALADAGWTPRVLARRDPVQPMWDGLDVEVVRGDLDAPAALRQLCEGADAVIHVAGLITAHSAAEFHAVNAEGSRHLAQAADAAAPQAPVILVSSIAAREPGLSAYAASKRAGEAAAREVVGDRLAVARPPAIYGPGDVATLGLFKLMAWTPVAPVLDPKARVALIHVADAARQIAALAAAEEGGRTVTLSDARPAGYSWTEIMRTAAAAMGRAPRTVRVADGLVRFAAGFAGAAMLSPDKAREILHLDWSVTPVEAWEAAPPPVYDLETGFADTVNGYRAQGWLRPA
ncbi:MAG: NAD(P)-dependent oxidoreductase [Caulobacteraceae bacterium]